MRLATKIKFYDHTAMLSTDGDEGDLLALAEWTRRFEDKLRAEAGHVPQIAGSAVGEDNYAVIIRHHVDNLFESFELRLRYDDPLADPEVFADYTDAWEAMVYHAGVHPTW